MHKLDFLFVVIAFMMSCCMSDISAQMYDTYTSFNYGFLAVSDEHQIFFEEFGNPAGVPVLIVHGGPGFGCEASLTYYFDPAYYRVIMFDQRGCGRSLSSDSMKNNSPQHSVRDMEQLREHLGIDTWILFGGSYGSLLSLLYGQTHPERVQHFVLRGIFLGRKKDYENLLGSDGMAQFFPEEYAQMRDLFSEQEQRDFITALDTRIMSENEHDYAPLARAFMWYDILCATVCPNRQQAQELLRKNFIVDVARAFIHYAAHNFFLTDNQLLDNMGTIAHISATIIHGRYDLICLPSSAYNLACAWPAATLYYIEDAGHSGREPGIAQALKDAMDDIREEPARRRAL